MGKRRQRNAQRMEKNEAGCMSGLIRMFDVRDGRFTRKLLVDRKHRSRNPAGADTTLKMLTYKDQKGTATELQDIEETTIDNSKTSVKKIMEDEIFDEKGLKKNMNIAGAQPYDRNIKNGGHVRDKPKQPKNLSKFCDMHANDLDVAGHSSQQLSNRETPYNLDLEVMLEELCHLHQKSSSCDHDWYESRSNQVYSLVQEELGAAMKVFMSQRFSDNGHLREDRHFLHSKEFIDALEILGVNKELFSEHLHDPNSLLAKYIELIENGNLTKDRHTNPLFESNLLDQEPDKPSMEKLSERKHHSFFRRRRSKSLNSNSLKDDDKCQPSSTIVILKPGSTALQNSGSKSLVSTSPESQWTMTNGSKTERNSSHFSLSEIKKKLKHVMTIEWHGVSRSGKSPHEFKNLKKHEKGVVEGNSGWSSPNRNHFFTERFAKSLLGMKKDDKIDRPEGSKTIAVNGLDGNPKQGIPKIYNEAKKHLSEMLSQGEEKEVSESKQLPKTLAKILSLPEYNSTSPGNNGNHNIVPAQVKFSLPGELDTSQETMPCTIQDNHASEHLPPIQCLESDSRISVEEPDIFASHKLGEHSYDKRVEVAMSPTHDNQIHEELLEIVTTDSKLRESIQVEDVSCTSSSLHETREIEILDAAELLVKKILDAAEIPEEEKSPRILTSNPIINDVLIQSPPVSPTSPSTTMEIENFDNCIDRADRPSPVSILEPLDSDDDISPASSKLLPVKETIEPLHICFDEWDSSDINQTVHIRTCLENEESAFEYVEAVLLGSGLNWDEYLLRWLLSDQILDPSLFDEVELFSSRSHDQKLLFDCTDNVLKETCERYFTRSLVKQGFRPVPNGMKLINEVWEGVEIKILQPPASHSLEQLVRKDMPKSEKWMDLYFETDHIVIELENFIINEMVEELVLISDDRTSDD